MSDEYVIYESKDYNYGCGTKVYIKDGQIVCDVQDECGYAGGEWFCDINILKQHIAKYEQSLKGEQ